MQENVQEVNDETTVRSELKKILLSLSYDTEPPRKRRKLEPDEKLLLRCKKLVRQLDGECGEVESVVVTETVLPKIKSVINGGLQLMWFTPTNVIQALELMEIHPEVLAAVKQRVSNIEEVETMEQPKRKKKREYTITELRRFLFNKLKENGRIPKQTKISLQTFRKVDVQQLMLCMLDHPKLFGHILEWDGLLPTTQPENPTQQDKNAYWNRMFVVHDLPLLNTFLARYTRSSCAQVFEQGEGSRSSNSGKFVFRAPFIDKQTV